MLIKQVVKRVRPQRNSEKEIDLSWIVPRKIIKVGSNEVRQECLLNINRSIINVIFAAKRDENRESRRLDSEELSCLYRSLIIFRVIEMGKSCSHNGRS